MTNREFQSYREVLSSAIDPAVIARATAAETSGEQSFTDAVLAAGAITQAELYSLQRDLFSSVLTVENLDALQVDIKTYRELGSEEIEKIRMIPIDLALSKLDEETDITTAAFISWDLTNEEAIDKINSNYVEAQFILCKFSEFQYLMNSKIKIASMKAYEDAIGLSAEIETAQSLNSSDSTQQKLLMMILEDGFSRRASDVHFDPIGGSYVVRYRIDGDLIRGASLNLAISNVFYNLLKEKANVNVATPDMPLKGQIQAELHKADGTAKLVSMRINMIRVGEQYSINIRFVGDYLPDLKSTLSETTYATVLRILQMTKGLILVVGPTGSGKSTLIYQVLAKISEQNKCILTVEDPVEFRIPGITQVNINEKNGIGWDDILESYMRHDPDVILVGEIRSEELARKALSTAETGHLVFSTLHTNDAIATINRLKYFGLDRQTIAESLSVVISQRLVKKICPHCRTEYSLPSNSPWREQFNLGSDEIKLYKGTGCSECDGTGYKGRISINEVLVSTREFRKLIIDNHTTDEIKDMLRSTGFVSMIEDGVSKAKAGLTTMDQLIKYIMDLD